ncbi:MAG TPA: LamG-like jellyroll fold domain-containing protein [Pyrinomonadaceae bacterium]
MFQSIIKQTAILIFVLLTIFSFGTQTARAQICQPATNGLVSWYRAEGDAADAQNSNNGALRNGTAFAPGRVRRAFKFDGADDFVEIPDAASLKPQNLTLEAWVKFDNLTSTVSGGAPPGFQYIVFKKNANQILFEGYSLIKLPDNRLAYTSISNSGVHTTVVDNTQTVEIGRYYHVVGTYDGTTARLYVNGRKVAEQFHGQPLDYDTRPVTIGATNEANWDGKMNGAIDEVKIYNRALSDSEIQANYFADNCRAAAEVPANLAAWHAGDGDTRDFTGANDGTIFFGNTKFIVGKVGQAFAFDVNGSGIGGGVQLPNSVFRGQTEGTIETWVRLRGLPVGQFGASAIWTEVEEPRTSTRFGIYYLADGKIGAFSDFSNINAISPLVVPQNEWLHVAAVYKSGETVKLYLNGALAAESPNTGGALSDTPAGFVGIGAYHSGFGDDFSLHGDVDEASTYRRALAASEIQSIYNAGSAGKIRKVTTDAGASVVNPLRDAIITFANVASAGETAQTPLETSTLPALPQGFGQTGLAYDISTTAVVSGSIDLCFNLPALAGERFSRLRVLHLENGAWVNRTTAVNSPQLCARVPSLSPFVIAENFAPTAASVTVGGRATTDGQGIGNAQITLTDANGQTRTAITNPFGYYRFTDIPAGATYILAARSKQYVFANPTQVVNVSEEITDADFTAQTTSFGRFR